MPTEYTQELFNNIYKNIPQRNLDSSPFPLDILFSVIIIFFGFSAYTGNEDSSFLHEASIPFMVLGGALLALSILFRLFSHVIYKNKELSSECLQSISLAPWCEQANTLLKNKLIMRNNKLLVKDFFQVLDIQNSYWLKEEELQKQELSHKAITKILEN